MSAFKDGAGTARTIPRYSPRPPMIDPNVAKLVSALKDARRWIKTYKGSLVGVTAQPILKTINDALRDVDAECS